MASGSREEDGIRRWGTRPLSQTPLMVLHIGKCGGGSVTMEMRALYQSYNWSVSLFPGTTRAQADSPDGGAAPMRSPKRHVTLLEHSIPGVCHPSAANLSVCPKYAGRQWCTAVTPLGMALSCGLGAARDKRHEMHGCARHGNGTKCDLVTTTHMLLGAELNMLPLASIKKTALDFDPSLAPIIDPMIQNGGKQPSLLAALDRQVQRTLKARGATFSSFYSLLPAMRTVMTREPFSYIASVHDWHNVKASCSGHQIEWAEKFALSYMMVLCGLDCPGRLAEGLATMRELERQADDNLKQSIAVVGLLNNFSQFVSMVRKRFTYTATFGLHSTKGQPRRSHSSSKSSQCKTELMDPSTRARWINQSSGMQMLLRLHETAVRVNHVQRSELQVV